MATIINNPDSSGSDGGVGLILGVILTLVVIILFFMYGLPAIRNNGGTNVNVPDKIDIEIK